jgi:beta-lactamase regulating signal transducer with metallopeptidase domain
MDDTGVLWLVLVIWLVGSAIGLAILFVVIRAAVVSGMTEMIKRGTFAVSVVSANPLRVSIIDDKSDGEPRSNGS